MGLGNGGPDTRGDLAVSPAEHPVRLSASSSARRQCSGPGSISAEIKSRCYRRTPAGFLTQVSAPRSGQRYRKPPPGCTTSATPPPGRDRPARTRRRPLPARRPGRRRPAVPTGRPPLLRHHRSRRTRTRRRPWPGVRACAVCARQRAGLLRHDHQPVPRAAGRGICSPHPHVRRRARSGTGYSPPRRRRRAARWRRSSTRRRAPSRPAPGRSRSIAGSADRR